ncbi:MAG: PEP-CTERM sorting domain-containing protein, partial [Planctomycetota bacterium]
GNAALMADDGLLDLSGEILEMGTIGTNDVDGVLSVANQWNSGVANAVELNGGILKGGKIIHESVGGITGFGTVTAAVDNRSFIAARGGNTLRIENDDTDWDGANGDGQLFALQGNLVLSGVTDNDLVGFNGDVGIGAGHELSIEGFDLKFATNSTLQMTGGVISSDVLQHFGGQLAIFEQAAEVRTDAIFETASENTLNARMTIFGETLIEAGASFEGSADLTSAVSSSLTLADMASIDVDLRGFGEIFIEDGIGDAFVNGDASSNLFLGLELAGNSIGDYDRLFVGDTVALRGIVDVSLLGYDPIAGDEFDLLDFKDFVDNGYELQLPELNQGLFWNVSKFESDGILFIAVPEPSTGCPILFALGLACLRRNRTS